MQKRIIYHASPESGITEFRFGVKDKGERRIPPSAIWFGTEMEGAAHHNRTVLKKEWIKHETRYIYKCCLTDDAIVINTKDAIIPKNIFIKLKRYFPLYRRLTMKEKLWYKYLFEAAEAVGAGNANDRFLISQKLGIDALIHPNTDKSGNPWDDSVYGIVFAVVNLTKIKILEENEYGPNDIIP